jgi:[ribosomal protein S5]-alanine N-acetyltransferase
MVVLTDGLVVLRPWRVAEAGWYVEQVRDRLIQDNTSEPADLTAAQVAEAIRVVAGDADRPGWAIVAAGTGDLLGNAALDLAAGTVSYWVAAAARGRGVATAALRLMVEHASAVGGLSELRLWVRAGNRAIARVAEKAGFTLAAHLDQTIDVRGETWIAHYYTCTRHQHA